jgi:hypothetical protein
MKTYLARYWAVYGISLVAPGLVACGDDTPAATTETESTTTPDETTTTTVPLPTTTTVDTTEGPDESSSSTSTSTGPEPTTGDTSSGTSGTTTTGDVTATTTTTDSTTGEPIECMTILCGDPVVCCLDTEECVDGSCEAICESGVRCGADQETCCDVGDVCVGTACTTPGGVCLDSYDCDPGEYCETVLGNCLPQPDPLLCEVIPNFDTVEVQLEWAHTADEVIAMPVVVDLDGDAIPEVVVNTTRTGGAAIDYPKGELICLDGATGALKWRIPHNPGNSQYGAHGRATIGVGDVSGDGRPDIIYAGRQKTNPVNDADKLSTVHAVDGDGVLLWTARTPQNTPAMIRIENGAATLANLDSDPEAEIAFGAALFDNDGLMVVNLSGIGAMYGTPHAKMMPTNYIYPGGIATFADLDNNGKLELVTGREAWNISWIEGPQPSVSLMQRWKDVSGMAGDGFPAVGDLDGNGTPEVVLTAWPEIKILDGATGALWCGVDPSGAMCTANPLLRTPPLPVPGGNLGGPPTIADFDGDGKPEIGIATGTDYRVFDLARPDEEIIKPAADPMPMPGHMYTRWVQVAQDASSGTTGSSVFDFQGDKRAEVAYQDECYARVYDGETGDVKLQIRNSSATIHEYPLVADVDGDGNSEFIVVANYSDDGAGKANAKCLAADADFVKRRGVFVYGAGGDNWVPTRPLWTQHTYHVTNAESDGNVPMSEQSNWTTPGLNNFRQNNQGSGVFNSPDLTASLSVALNLCGDELRLVATIYNEGALGVPLGIDVTFYEGTDNTGLKLSTQMTSEPILTGGSTVVELVVPAPPDGETRNYYVEVDEGVNNGAVLECEENNNSAVVTDATCPDPG